MPLRGPRGPLHSLSCLAQSLTQMEREKIVWEFEQLYHSLKEHEYRLLARLEELDLAIYNSINGAITQFSCNISHLSGLIAQLEEKQQQPTRELLQVGHVQGECSPRRAKGCSCRFTFSAFLGC